MIAYLGYMENDVITMSIIEFTHILKGKKWGILWGDGS